MGRGGGVGDETAIQQQPDCGRYLPDMAKGFVIICVHVCVERVHEGYLVHQVETLHVRYLAIWLLDIWLPTHYI